MAFQSTPPARGATPEQIRPVQSITISIHAPREGGDLSEAERVDAVLDISIHAPREGGDPGRHRAASPGRWISIHAPREGGDRNLAVNTLPELSFQSTPPARGATTARYTSGSVIIFQSTPPREGGDCCTTRATLVTPPFQSTPPARGATPTEPMLSAMCIISIHAPREGGDLDAVIAVQDQIDISIHAPREGGDPQQRSRLTPQPDHFNPRPPRGGRLLTGSFIPLLIDFNPRPPRGGRRKTVGTSWRKRRFQSTPPARGATNRGRCRCN